MIPIKSGINLWYKVIILLSNGSSYQIIPLHNTSRIHISNDKALLSVDFSYYARKNFIIGKKLKNENLHVSKEF